MYPSPGMILQVPIYPKRLKKHWRIPNHQSKKLKVGDTTDTWHIISAEGTTDTWVPPPKEHRTAQGTSDSWPPWASLLQASRGNHFAPLKLVNNWSLDNEHCLSEGCCFFFELSARAWAYFCLIYSYHIISDQIILDHIRSDQIRSYHI